MTTGMCKYSGDGSIRILDRTADLKENVRVANMCDMDVTPLVSQRERSAINELAI